MLLKNATALSQARVAVKGCAITRMINRFFSRLFCPACLSFAIGGFACSCDDDDKHAYDTYDATQTDAITSDSALETDATTQEDASTLPDGGLECGSMEDAKSYLLIEDETQGIAIGNTAGCDIDAVHYQCPDDESGSAIALLGTPGANAASSDLSLACGASDCNTNEDCAAHLGISGSILLGFSRASLSGCTLHIYEQDDHISNESCRVSVCQDPQNLTSCVWLITVKNGETAETTVP